MDKRQWLNNMKHSPLHNYAGIPGLVSWLIGQPTEKGTLRMFECSRNHHEVLVPHSHRYDFICEVISGNVENMIWYPDKNGDMCQVSELVYGTKPGKYKEKRPAEISLWSSDTRVYRAGHTYQMTHDEIHSIKFSKDSVVLFHEGPKVSETSVILEPVVDGKLIPTFKVEPWMFKRTK